MQFRPFRKRNKACVARSLLARLEDVNGVSNNPSETSIDILASEKSQQEQEQPQPHRDDANPLSLEHRWSSARVEKTIQLWKLTQEQQAKLMELKRRVSDIDHWKNDPHELVRFLLEKRGNVDRAESLFRRVYQWRMENNIDTIVKDYKVSPLFNYFPIATLQGVDHDGDPIHLERPGAADCVALCQRLSAQDIYQMTVCMREIDTDPHQSPWYEEYEKQQGHPMKQFTIVVDLEGLSRNHMRPYMVPIFGRCLLLSQNQYPYFAKKIILLRAPRIFKVFWSLTQHFVHASQCQTIDRL